MADRNTDLLLTDALLLDAVDGLDSIAGRLAELYDRMNASSANDGDVVLLATVLTDLGWWSGRFEGAISTQTMHALTGLVSGAS